MMEFTSVAADPFSILTIVVAPAVLTNASSVLALGTTGRLARVADRTPAAGALVATMEPGARNSVSSFIACGSLFFHRSRTLRQLSPHRHRRFNRRLFQRARCLPDSRRH